MSQVVQRIVTGTPGLDKMLHGGLWPGSLYLVIGPPGSGKTILAVQFLLEGVKRGEKVLLVALDEPPAEIRDNLGQMFGSNFDSIRVLDATLEMKSYERTPVRDVSIQRKSESFGGVFPEIARSADLRNPELTANAVQEMIKNEILKNKITRLVIDSATSMRYFLMTNGDRNQFMQSFFRFLGDLRITTLVTIQDSHYHDLIHRSCGVEDIMARGIIRQYRWLQNNGFRLGVAIEKFRGSKHDTKIRRAKINHLGFLVLDGQGRRRGDR